jgi:hypothetical protein
MTASKDITSRIQMTDIGYQENMTGKKLKKGHIEFLPHFETRENN